MSEARKELQAELDRLRHQRSAGLTNRDVFSTSFALALGAAVVAIENAERLDRLEQAHQGESER